jgi:hypothetical protein
MNPYTLVLTIGSEGGILEVYLLDSHYYAVSHVSALPGYDEPRKSTCTARIYDSSDSFDGLLVKLDRYNWHELYPLFCHSDYVESLLLGKSTRDENARWSPSMNVEDWRQRLGLPI